MAAERFHLDHSENIARRLADIVFYEQAIDRELASAGDPFLSAELVQTHLIGYLGSVKSLLDAIAICLDALYPLGLKEQQRDLCREKLHEVLAKQKAARRSRWQC